MEEVVGSIPTRSTKQPLEDQAYAGSGSLPPLSGLVLFDVKRAEGLRRLLTTVPVEAEFFVPFRGLALIFAAAGWRGVPVPLRSLRSGSNGSEACHRQYG